MKIENWKNVFCVSKNYYYKIIIYTDDKEHIVEVFPESNEYVCKYLDLWKVQGNEFYYFKLSLIFIF